MKQKPKLTPFQKAVNGLPSCWLGFDPIGQHEKISDLVFSIQHEIDLYEEDEETDIQTKAQLAQCRAYIVRWKDISES